MSFRKDRINEAVKESLNRVMGTVKDPRVAGKFPTVTAAQVSGDLSDAKIYISVLQGDADEAVQGLNAAKGYLRTALAAELNLRATPKLTFVRDRAAENGAHIAGILRTLGEREEKDG